MYTTLMCVGGPWHGQRKNIGHGDSMLMPKAEPTVLEPAWAAPNTLIPSGKTGVYKRETLQIGHENGIEVRITVLAYYGTERSDRPKDFHL